MIEYRFPHLKLLVRDPGCKILMFHDGMGILPQFAVEGVLEEGAAIFTFSWNVSTKSATYIASQFEAASKFCGDVDSRVRLLLNSPEEFERAA
jgi:hypothetical protein